MTSNADILIVASNRSHAARRPTGRCSTSPLHRRGPAPGHALHAARARGRARRRARRASLRISIGSASANSDYRADPRPRRRTDALHARERRRHDRPERRRASTSSRRSTDNACPSTPRPITPVPSHPAHARAAPSARCCSAGAVATAQDSAERHRVLTALQRRSRLDERDGVGPPAGRLAALDGGRRSPSRRTSTAAPPAWSTRISIADPLRLSRGAACPARRPAGHRVPSRALGVRLRTRPPRSPIRS